MEIRDRNHPEDPQGWDVIRQRRGQSPKAEFYPPHSSVRDNIDSFGRAIRGEIEYPVPYEEMVSNARTFEAITRSAMSGRVEYV